MPTLADLKAQHPGICFNCGSLKDPLMHDLAGCPWPEHPLIAALIAKALEDEAAIEELRNECIALHLGLKAEREAHEVTRRALEEVDRALTGIADEENTFGRHRWTIEAALAREEARKKEVK